MSTIQAPSAPATPSAPSAPAAPPAAAPSAPPAAASTPAPAGDRTTLSPEASGTPGSAGPVPNLANAFGAPPAASPAAAPAAAPAGSQPVPQRADEALRNRDFQAQTQIAQEMLQRAGRGEAFTSEERTALRNIADGAQINATLQAAIYQKTSTPNGPGGATAFEKTQVGIVASNDPRVRSGGYVGYTLGAELRVPLPNGTTITPYTQYTVRSDRATAGVEDTHGSQSGVRVEQRVGPARVGVDLNNTQSVLTGKVEREFATPGALPGSTTRVGADVSLSARGNAFARETAQRAIELERRNQSMRALSERYNIPFRPQAAN